MTTINFSDLEIPKPPDSAIVESLIKGRYVMGLDPLDSEKESKKKGYPVNVFTVYDKALMRNVTRIVSKRPFDHIKDSFLKNEVSLRMFSTSYKFVNPDGTAKSKEQIRNEAEIGSKRLEEHSPAF